MPKARERKEEGGGKDWPRLVSVKRATGMKRQEARLFEREARVSEIPAECRERVAKQAQP